MEIRYGGYLERAREMVAKLAELEGGEVSGELEYRSFGSVSFEAREKLALRRPGTLGQASRIPGISPSDLQAIVMEVVKRRSR